MRKPLIIGNWKMNGQLAESEKLIRQLVVLLAEVTSVDVAVCPPYTSLGFIQQLLSESTVSLGAQNGHQADKGAFTGEVSMPMLKEIGCTYVLVGHSERRQHFGEDDSLIAEKVAAAVRHGLIPVLCVGESLTLRESGLGEAHVLEQVKRGLSLLPENERSFIIAYEPIWAIGTGKAANATEANSMLTAIRSFLGPDRSEVRLLYGGSVTPDNMSYFTIEPNIDGALVGGASLKADMFAEIVKISGSGPVHV